MAKIKVENNLALPMTLPNLISTIDTVHQTFQTRALQSVSVNLTLRNFVIGYYIVEYEQNGSDRATYGSKLIENMAKKLSHIKGMSIYNNAMLNGECLILNEKRVA